MKVILKKYIVYFILIGLALVYYFIYQYKNEWFIKIISVLSLDFLEQFLLLPPIVLLISVIDYWLEENIMIKLMGKESGKKGMIMAFGIGTIGVGPLYVAFPLAALFHKKGVSYKNIQVMLGAWSTTKFTQIILEINSMGVKYSLCRLVVNILGIIVIATLMDKMINKK